jgi:hypothetical protein
VVVRKGKQSLQDKLSMNPSKRSSNMQESQAIMMSNWPAAHPDATDPDIPAIMGTGSKKATILLTPIVNESKELQFENEIKSEESIRLPDSSTNVNCLETITE